VARNPKESIRRSRLVDVARIAGVSPITVSRALREPDKVSDKALTRINSAIVDSGYVPDLVASSLASRRSRLIGLVIPTVTASVYAATVAGISDALGTERFQSLLGNSGYDLEHEGQLVAAFLGRRADGIILSSVSHSPETHRLLGNANIPVVETGNLTDTPIDMVVGFSNYDAAYDMMRHLFGRGHRHIGFIGAPTNSNPQASDRQRAYHRAVKDFALPADPNLVIETEPKIWEGRKAAAELIERHPGLDAIFAAGEVWAIGAVIECQHRGRRVPEQIAIGGYNDADMGEHMNPPLTTIRVPRYEIGNRAASMIVQRLAGQQVPEKVVDVGYELVVRAST